MSKAYLAWPVKITGILHETHVTLKYIGELTKAYPLLLNDISARLALYLPNGTGLDLSEATWKPAKFTPSTWVLELHGVHDRNYDMHTMLATLRPDDYPGWRPHITVTKELFNHVKKEGTPMRFLLEDVGRLTLFVDKKPAHVFGLCLGCGEARCQGECY